MKIWVAVLLIAGIIVAGFAAAGVVVVCGIVLFQEAADAVDPPPPRTDDRP